MNVYIIVALLLAAYLAVAWLLGILLRLQGSSFWILWSCLAVIGVAAAAIFLWFRRKLQRGQTSTLDSVSVSPADLKSILQRAEQKLRTSPRPQSLDSLPVVFVLGESGSAKTSIVVHSGLDPELLAGQVYQDSELVSTSAINVWFARGTVFIEAGGRITSDALLWGQLLQHTRPKRFSAALGKGQQAARAVVLCFECERLAAAQNSARGLRNRLKEMAESLGASFPLYVVFTKLDRIKNFADFVENITPEESAQPLGATFPRVKIEGVFAERESVRLSSAFDQIVYSLAEKRLDYLRRDASGEKLPGIYEFPRELKRLRNLLVQFLVEVGRPAQLNASPFLRGFYLAGVRAVIRNEAIALSAGAPTSAALPSQATRIFTAGEANAAPAPAASGRAVQSKKVPEWCFLPGVFTEIIIRDRNALSSSRQSTRINHLRRWMLGGVAALFSFYAAALLVSFSHNRSLEREVRRNAASLSASTNDAGGVAGHEQLRHLEQLRRSLLKLSGYETGGPPLGYRFGLYRGDGISAEASKLYFAEFRRLLLAPTQDLIAAKLRTLPQTPSPEDDYGYSYDSLKAYLMTTVRADRSTVNFLAPTLLDRWSQGRGVEQERLILARLQFEFYASRLQRGNMYAIDTNRDAITAARVYLNGFQHGERVYQRLIADAGKNIASIDFNRMFPGSAAVVVDNHIVPAAFTTEGFKYVQAAVREPIRFFGGEDWVLEDKGATAASAGALMESLKTRYEAEYRQQWLAFLDAAKVVGYASLPDASGKLQTISANTSPMLQLLLLVAQNTSVNAPMIAKEFQPVQTLMVGASKDILIGNGNDPYIADLRTLQSTIAALLLTYPNGTTDQNAASPVINAATSGKKDIGQIAARFQTTNQTNQLVQKLMAAPITSTLALVQGYGAEALNGSGQALCNHFREIGAKYPFNPLANTEAVPEDLKFFQPGSGELWSFFDANLKNLVVRQQGNQFAVNPSAKIRISPQFLAYLHHAAVFSDAIFPQGQGPNFSFTVRQLANKGINRLELSINGKTLALAGDKEKSETFAWPGDGKGVHLAINRVSEPMPVDYSGLWGVFQFFGAASRSTSGPSGTTFELPMQTTIAGRKVGEGLVLRYEVEGQAGEVFRNGFFQNLRCPPLRAH